MTKYHLKLNDYSVKALSQKNIQKRTFLSSITIYINCTFSTYTYI